MFDQNYENRVLGKQNSQSPSKSHCTSGAAYESSVLSPSRTNETSPRYGFFSGDRFIPNRCQKNWRIKFSSMVENDSREPSRQKDERYSDYTCLLKHEVLGNKYKHVNNQENNNIQFEDGRLFHYSSQIENNNLAHESALTANYSLSPVSIDSHKFLRSCKRPTRKISKIPYKILDAPELQDDFYLNLLDWSSQNTLSVGLGVCVYLWSPFTLEVSKICDLTPDGNSITSVAWHSQGNLLAVGTHDAIIQIWDVDTNKLVKTISGHRGRVGCLAWNKDILCSGSRDRTIQQNDIRSRKQTAERKLLSHRQEVCGLKWSPDNQYLASGGNDNRLYIWNLHSESPIQTHTAHTAAVKALAWSPHHQGRLASGGGTADRCIRFWNILTGQLVRCIDTGSQVCNLAWAKYSSEFVSTHGFSQNQIIVWKYPDLRQVARLTGHTFRVLYLAVSPDGNSIVTGAGDETLRFWNVFSKSMNSPIKNQSCLKLYTGIR